MKILNINPKDIIFSLDIGTRTVIGTAGVVREKKFHVVCESCVEHKERAMIDGQIHDISKVASAVNIVKKNLESKLNFPLKDVAIAAAGRFLRTATVKDEMEIDDEVEISKEVIRSLEISAVKKAQEKVDDKSEGKLYCVGYSVKNYYLNGYVISNLLSHRGENISVEIIATFLPRTVVDSLYAVMEKVGLSVVSLTLEPIAAIEAAIPKSMRLLNLALVDIGAGTSDIAISSNDTVSAYGMVPLAGDEVTEAIAQNCLVDFNTAEIIKKECSQKEEIKYIDVLGMENSISSKEVMKVITPVVEKISEQIAEKITELNGEKSPNAVFLVGGGAHTPQIKECIAQKLNLPQKRIAIKGRESITNCICEDNSLGSTGVTVIGIAFVSIARMGNDFIDVVLNGNVVSLFNSYRHTVMDVIMQAGINAKVLIGRNGKNTRFTLNGSKKVAFGTLAENAKIIVNDEEANIDTSVEEGDKIDIIYAHDGKNAAPKVFEYINGINVISFYLDNKIRNIEPICFINGNRVTPDDEIKELDDVKIIKIKTLGEYIEYFGKENEINKEYYIDDKSIDDTYLIRDGDKIFSSSIEDTQEENERENVQDQNMKECAVASDTHVKKNTITVNVNDKPTTLTNKENYVFVDLFNYISFDLSLPRGNLVLKLNDKNAGYYDKLKDGDIIKIYWEKR